MQTATTVMLQLKSRARKSPPGYWQRAYQALQPHCGDEFDAVFEHPKYMFADKHEPADLIAQEAIFDVCELMSSASLEEVSRLVP